MSVNTSATGGYIKPPTKPKLPQNLTLEQFLQTVLVGVSEIPGDLVRPKWQPSPPKQPDINTNWLAFGIELSRPDAHGYQGFDSDGKTVTQRHEDLEVPLQIYGPGAYDIGVLIRDSLEIPQNLEQLKKANMGFVNVGPMQHIPDLINERWFNRYVMSVFFRREIERKYPILSILSANGTIYSVTEGEDYTADWSVEEN